MITGLILFAAFVILGWGFYRARPLGKLGLLAWLQSVVLMLPWLILFGLITLGISVNLAGILLLLVISIGCYVFLGNRLRSLGQTVVSQTSTLEEANADRNQPKPPEPEPTATTTEATAIIPIPEADLKEIKGIFGVDTFFATETIPYQEGVIFKGNLRGEPGTVRSQLAEKLQHHFPDQYRLFLVENQDSKPVVIVLPSRNDPQPLTISQKILAGVLLIVTIATCFETGSLLQGFSLWDAPNRIIEALPIGLGIVTILAVHEVGHYVIAQRHQVKLDFPFFLPALQIGSFGALTRFASLLSDRKVLFDVAIAGPAAGGILSLVLLVCGLLISTPQSLFQIPAPFFQSSILVGSLSRALLGDTLQQPLVAVHPLVVIGWLGLVITALNLMPAGQLDGGRITQAIYGRKIAGRTTIATLILLAIASLTNPLPLYWAILILFLQRDLERPSLDEISEPDDARAAFGLLALFLMAAILIPLAPGLADRLGIGS